MKQPVPITEAALKQAASLLRSGRVVAFPTETYYGLAVDPFDVNALERLFQIKKRPRELPILMLVSGRDQLRLTTDNVYPAYDRLIECFWPGPLTLVCPARACIPPQLTGNTGTVGIRHSSNPTANRLLAAFGGPITATSANISGCPAAVTAGEVARVFGDDVDLVLDGGETPGDGGSTLVGMHGTSLVCLREGKIPFAAVQACIAPH